MSEFRNSIYLKIYSVFAIWTIVHIRISVCLDVRVPREVHSRISHNFVLYTAIDRWCPSLLSHCSLHLESTFYDVWYISRITDKPPTHLRSRCAKSSIQALSLHSVHNAPSLTKATDFMNHHSMHRLSVMHPLELIRISALYRPSLSSCIYS